MKGLQLRKHAARGFRLLAGQGAIKALDALLCPRLRALGERIEAARRLAEGIALASGRERFRGQGAFPGPGKGRHPRFQGLERFAEGTGTGPELGCGFRILRRVFGNFGDLGGQFW